MHNKAAFIFVILLHFLLLFAYGVLLLVVITTFMKILYRLLYLKSNKWNIILYKLYVMHTVCTDANKPYGKNIWCLTLMTPPKKKRQKIVENIKKETTENMIKKKPK